MKKQLIIAIITLVMVSLSCTLQNVDMSMDTIETREVLVSEPLPDSLDQVALSFQMTGGKFSLHPGAVGLVDGTIVYNVEQWEPEFTRSTYRYEIEQVNPFNLSGIPTGDVVNRWDLTLTNALPLDITVEGGASENDFDFSGLQITNLLIRQGASESTIRFQSLNPVVMENFSFTTGASSAKIYGLGNANFERMSMSAGAGDYTLDFSGSLSQNSVVDIKAGISNLTIIIPSGMNAIINNEGTVSNINTQGTWLVMDDSYTTAIEGPQLTVNLDMAVGNINLIHQE